MSVLLIGGADMDAPHLPRAHVLMAKRASLLLYIRAFFSAMPPFSMECAGGAQIDSMHWKCVAYDGVT